MLFTRYRDTPLRITREDLLPGLTVWVVEPIGHWLEIDAAGRHLTHRLPVRAGTTLDRPLVRITEDLDTLPMVVPA